MPGFELKVTMNIRFRLKIIHLLTSTSALFIFNMKASSFIHTMHNNIYGVQNLAALKKLKTGFAILDTIFCF